MAQAAKNADLEPLEMRLKNVEEKLDVSRTSSANSS
jgi:hypothetical protein